MVLALAFGIPTLLILVYVLGGRRWLKSKPWATGFFATIEPIEITLWRKSETILWARFQQLIGIVLTLLTGLGALDLSPLFPLLPEKYKWVPTVLPLIITCAGKISEMQRVSTTKPVELVELPDKMSPRMAEVVRDAEITKQVAVAVAEDATAKKSKGSQL
jgi:hypothetical protein